MAWEDKPRKLVSRRVIAAVLLLLVLGSVALYWLIIDPFIHYESLELYKSEPYWWVANAKGQVTLIQMNLGNNGTKTLTMDNVWVNGTLVNESNVRYYFINWLSPGDGTGLFVFPEGFVFQDGQNYNFTVGTTSGRHFTFVLPVDDAHKKQENITITKLDFIFLPDTPMEIIVHVRNGPTTVLPLRALVNGTEAPTEHNWITESEGAFAIEYGFHYNFTYVVSFQTTTGNIYEFTGIAD